MNVVPFRAEHLDEVGGAGVAVEEARALEQHSSWTAIRGGEVLGCAGVVKMWPGRYTAWAYLSPTRSGPHMRRITTAVRVFLESLGARRVELTVQKDFENGHRWAKVLGFEVEAPCLKAFGPQGEDHVGYVRL